jgi:hypothetical protein
VANGATRSASAGGLPPRRRPLLLALATACAPWAGLARAQSQAAGQASAPLGSTPAAGPNAGPATAPAAAPAMASGAAPPAPSVPSASGLSPIAGAATGASTPAPSTALRALAVRRGEEGVSLDYVIDLALSPAVEDALHRGVSLTFMALAETYRQRWYWRDERVGREQRLWRLTWQPLTRNYRTSLGAVAQSHASLAEALATLSRTSGWRVAPRLAADDDRYYVEFGFRLDTSLLPRPLQIGIAGSSEWQLAVLRTLPVPDPVR